ncbi:hypothetical protein KR215_002081, partial [Drosophila sulfurigaster]
VDFTNIEIDNRLPKVIITLNHWINRTSNIPTIFGNFKVSEDLYNITGTYNLKVKHTEKFMNYFTLDFDVCKSREMLYSQYAAKIIERELRAVSNYPLNCPVKKNYEYYLKGFTIGPNLIPGYLPNFFFLSNLTFYRNLQTGINIVITGQVRRK